MKMIRKTFKGDFISSFYFFPKIEEEHLLNIFYETNIIFIVNLYKYTTVKENYKQISLMYLDANS